MCPLHPETPRRSLPILFLQVVTEHQLWVPCSIQQTHAAYLFHMCPAPYIKLTLVIYFTCGNVYVSILFFQIILPPPFPTESQSLFFMSVSPLLPCKQIHQYHLSRLHMYVLIYSICFSLYD